MKGIVKIAPSKYQMHLQNQLERRLVFGQSRFTGWCLGSFFSVRYHDGKGFGRRNHPIANKALGFIKETNGETAVSYVIFRGYTDPSSLFGLFCLSFLIFVVVDAPFAALFGILWTAAVAIFTFLCTRFSALGQASSAQLIAFLSDPSFDMSDF